MNVADALDWIAKVELPTLGHTLETGFCGPAIHPIGDVHRTAGVATTLDLIEPDALAVNEAILRAEAGSFLVIRVASGVHAPVGAVTVAAAAAAGIAGIVVGGPVTDIRTLAGGPVPVWAAGVTARTTKRLGAEAHLDVPVAIGDATVHLGDIVAGDEHGVLVLRPDELDEALFASALASDEAEPALLARIAAGEPLTSILHTKQQESA